MGPWIVFYAWSRKGYDLTCGHAFRSLCPQKFWRRGWITVYQETQVVNRRLKKVTCYRRSLSQVDLIIVRHAGFRENSRPSALKFEVKLAYFLIYLINNKFSFFVISVHFWNTEFSLIIERVLLPVVASTSYFPDLRCASLQSIA